MSNDQEAYNERINKMQRYVPFLKNLITTLQNTPKTGERDFYFHKMQTLMDILTSSKKRTNPDVLIRAEGALSKLQKIHSLNVSRIASLNNNTTKNSESFIEKTQDLVKDANVTNDVQTESLIEQIKAEITTKDLKTDSRLSTQVQNTNRKVTSPVVEKEIKADCSTSNAEINGKTSAKTTKSEYTNRVMGKTLNKMKIKELKHTEQNLAAEHSVKNLSPCKVATKDKDKAIVDAHLQGIKKDLADQLLQVKSSSKLLAKELGITFKVKDRRNKYMAAKSKSGKKTVASTPVNSKEITKTTENMEPETCTQSIEKTVRDDFNTRKNIDQTIIHKTSKPNSDSKISFSEGSKKTIKSSKDDCLTRQYTKSRHTHHKKVVKDKSKLHTTQSKNNQFKEHEAHAKTDVTLGEINTTKIINSNCSSSEHKLSRVSNLPHASDAERKPTSTSNLTLSANDTSGKSSKMCQSMTKMQTNIESNDHKTCESSFKMQKDGKSHNFSGTSKVKHKKSKRFKHKKHRSKEVSIESNPSYQAKHNTLETSKIKIHQNSNPQNSDNSKNQNTSRKDSMQHESKNQNDLKSNVKIPKIYLKNIKGDSSNAPSKQSEAYISFDKPSKSFTICQKFEDLQENKSLNYAKSHDLQHCSSSFTTENDSLNSKRDSKSTEEANITIDEVRIDKSKKGEFSKRTTASPEEESVLVDSSQKIEVNNNIFLDENYANHEKKIHYQFMQILASANMDEKLKSSVLYIFENKALNVVEQLNNVIYTLKDQIPKETMNKMEIMLKKAQSESNQSAKKRPIEKPSEQNEHSNAKRAKECDVNKKKKGHCGLVREMATIQRDMEEMFKLSNFGDPTGRRICSIESELKTRAHLEMINKVPEEDKCGALKRRKSLFSDSKRVKLDIPVPLIMHENSQSMSISEQVSYQRSSDKPESSFNELSAINNSFKTVQKGNKFSGKCLFCNKLIEKSEIEWFEHIFGHNNQYLYHCSYCKNKGLAKCDSKLSPECETNQNIKAMLTQQINSDNVKVFICGFCNYVDCRTEYMINHLTKNHHAAIESSHLEMFHKVFTIVFLKIAKSNCSNKETIVISDSEDDDGCNEEERKIQENNKSEVDQIMNQKIISNNFLPNNAITSSDAKCGTKQNVLIEPRISSSDIETRKHVMETPSVETAPVNGPQASEKYSSMITKRSSTHIQTKNEPAAWSTGFPLYSSVLSSDNNAGVQPTSESSVKHYHIENAVSELSSSPEKQEVSNNQKTQLNPIESSDITNQSPYNIQIYFQEQIHMMQPSNVTDMVLVLTNDTKDPNLIETYIIEDVKVDHNEKSTNLFQEDTLPISTGVATNEENTLNPQKDSEEISSELTKPFVIPKYVPPDLLYVCPQKECNAGNESSEYLEMHLKIMHNETKQFICCFCNTKTSAMLDHLKYHSKIIYKCSLCDFIHYKYYDLAIHIQLEHNGKVDKITILSRGSCDETKHLEFVHLKQEEIWKCNICFLTNQSHRYITNHIDSTHKNIFFSCKFCKHSTDQEQSLIQHHKAFHSQQQLEIIPNYPSPIVNLFHKTIETAIKKLVAETNLTRVCSTIHSPDDNITAPEPCSTQNITFTCKYCFECFDDVSSIEQHWMYAHDTSLPFEFGISKKYKCSYCNLETSLEYLKNHHMKSHHQYSFKIDNNIIQDMSDLWLSSADDIKDDLIEEMIKGNDNVKLIECLKCSALFREIEYAYLHHEQAHTDLMEIKLCKHSEKRLLWGCNLCQMFYSTEKHLINHFWSHLKVYICRFCFLNFEDHDQLVNHYKMTHEKNEVTYLTSSNDGGYNIECYKLNCVVLFKNGLLLRKEELINTKLGKFDNFNNTIHEIVVDELNYWKRIQDTNQRH